MYKYIRETWKEIYKDKERLKALLVSLRKEPTMKRIERPSRLDRARMLGYKPIQGVIVVRVKVAKGGMRKSRPKAGRRPKHLGVVKIKANINAKEVAIGRVKKRYPNMRVLGAYYLCEDGKHKWYEVILEDPNHPRISRR